MAGLTREQILAHAGLPDKRTVDLPGWGGEVTVRGMTTREFETNQAALGDKKGEATAALVVRCVLDDAGARIFTDKDISAVAELPFAQVNAIGKVISELSGLSDGPTSAVAAGNSPAAQSGESSPSGSSETEGSAAP